MLALIGNVPQASIRNADGIVDSGPFPGDDAYAPRRDSVRHGW